LAETIDFRGIFGRMFFSTYRGVLESMVICQIEDLKTVERQRVIAEKACKSPRRHSS